MIYLLLKDTKLTYMKKNVFIQASVYKGAEDYNVVLNNLKNYKREIEHYQPRNQFEKKELTGRKIHSLVTGVTLLSGTTIKDKTSSDMLIVLNGKVCNCELKIRRYYSTEAWGGESFEPYLDKQKINYMKESSPDQIIPVACIVFLLDGVVKYYYLDEEFSYFKRLCEADNTAGDEKMIWKTVTALPDCLVLHEEKIDIPQEWLDHFFEDETEHQYTEQGRREKFERRKRRYINWKKRNTYIKEELPEEYFQQLTPPPYIR